ncbi:unnamed protein product [Schistocephalus solidus]|uniref:Nuclear receptor domain-containing protein n=1 Tax=Schistocephalus solidus TaxID=70667 RepID=A0A183SS95_SCHSO|nr:unnamed protein product [Schistocephalus solidus]
MNCPVQDKNNQKADLENRGSFFVRHKNEKSCAVCGDHAVGYNFGAIACESCKAFFRRNALRPTVFLLCLYSSVCRSFYSHSYACKASFCSLHRYGGFGYLEHALEIIVVFRPSVFWVK